MAKSVTLKQEIDGVKHTIYPQTTPSQVVNPDTGRSMEELEETVKTLNGGSYLISWDGASAPVAANIPAGVSVTYSSTTYTGTLAASPSTEGKIYLVYNGTEFDRYITTKNGSVYSWFKAGDMSLDLVSVTQKTNTGAKVASISVGSDETGIYNGVEEYKVSFEITGYINRQTGDLVANNSWRCTDYILISFDSKVFWKAYYTSTPASVAFYNKEKTFISAVNGSSGSAKETELINIPNGTRYLRFSNDPSECADAYVLVKGNMSPTLAIVQTQNDIGDLQSYSQETRENVQGLVGQIYSYASGNITLLAGRIAASTGVVSGGSGYGHISIQVSYGDVIIFKPHSTGSTGQGGYGYAFYDSNDAYITGNSPTIDVACQVVVPNGAVTWKYGFEISAWGNNDYSVFSHIKSNSIVGLIKREGLDLSTYLWNAVGDSITNGDYMSAVKKLTGISYTNYGLAGCTIAVNAAGDTASGESASSIVERVCGINGRTAIEDADVWTIFGGLNDCYYSSPIGSLSAIGSTYDNTTVYGALQMIVEKIMSVKRPRLVLMTPPHSLRDSFASPTYPTTMALIRKAIIDVGELYGVPVCDVWAESGINRYNISRDTDRTTTDGLHWNDLGKSYVAPLIARYLRDALM